MEYTLTKEANALLTILYCNYKKKKETLPREQARMIEGLNEIQELTKSSLHFEDLKDICSELSQSGMLENLYADNTIYNCSLTISAIQYIENKDKKFLKEIVSSIFPNLSNVFKNI